MRSVKFRILLILTIVIACCTIYKTSTHSTKNYLTNIALVNIEALATEESGNNEKKIYRYQTWHNEECWVYVGGAYAKGKKVSCHSGHDHPRCVDCQL